MSKLLEFLKRLEEVKSRLPVGVVPLYLKAYPKSNVSRVKNTIAGKVQDETVLNNLTKLAEAIEKIKKNETSAASRSAKKQ